MPKEKLLRAILFEFFSSTKQTKNKVFFFLKRKQFFFLFLSRVIKREKKVLRNTKAAFKNKQINFFFRFLVL